MRVIRASPASRFRIGTLVLVLLPAMAAAVPVLAQDACDYRGGTSAGGQGIILGFLSPEQAERLITVTQARVHATISPQYIANRRVVVGLANGRRAVVLLPNSVIAKPGDRVAFAPGHRDFSWPCSYVPNLVVGRVRPFRADARPATLNR